VFEGSVNVESLRPSLPEVDDVSARTLVTASIFVAPTLPIDVLS